MSELQSQSVPFSSHKALVTLSLESLSQTLRETVRCLLVSRTSDFRFHTYPDYQLSGPADLVSAEMLTAAWFLSVNSRSYLGLETEVSPQSLEAPNIKNQRIKTDENPHEKA